MFSVNQDRSAKDSTLISQFPPAQPDARQLPAAFPRGRYLIPWKVKFHPRFYPVTEEITEVLLVGRLRLALGAIRASKRDGAPRLVGYKYFPTHLLLCQFFLKTNGQPVNTHLLADE